MVIRARARGSPRFIGGRCAGQDSRTSQLSARRCIPCWKLSKDGEGRTLQACGLPDDLLSQAAEKWPAAQIEIAHEDRYSLMPGFGRTGIPLGAGAAQAEAALRKLLLL